MISKPSEVSFRATTNWLMMVGNIAHTPCGTRTYAMTCVLRIPSEYAASRCPLRWSESLPVARSAPSARESTAAYAKALRVLSSPRRSRSWMPSYAKGVHFADVNWPVSNSRYSTQPASARMRSADRTP